MRIALLIAGLFALGCGRIGFQAADAGSGMDAAAVAGDSGSASGCGDGMLDGTEVCDDGNEVGGDGCAADCSRRELCGDMIVDPPELCDDGNSTPGDGCENNCTFSCETDGDCDDEQECTGPETCNVAEHACEPTIDRTDGVACTEGTCRSGLCAAAGCGNMVRELLEECDDGNLIAGDGCESDCMFTCEVDLDCSDRSDCNGAETCVPDVHTCEPSPEALANGTMCERDGAIGTRDICLAGVCEASRCGDGYVDPGATPPEECEDGNLVKGDGCDNDCSFSCRFDVECDDRAICNGSETCDPTTNACVSGTTAPNGTVCAVTGMCFSGMCLVPIDAGTVDSGAPDAGDDCPVPLTWDAPELCFRRCSMTSECVHVSETCCCGCNEGGTSTAINSDQALLWSTRMAMMCDCAGTVCPDVDICPLGGPTCIAGQCKPGGAS